MREKKWLDSSTEYKFRCKIIFKNIGHVVNKEHNLSSALMCPQNGRKLQETIELDVLIYFIFTVQGSRDHKTTGVFV